MKNFDENSFLKTDPFAGCAISLETLIKLRLYTSAISLFHHKRVHTMTYGTYLSNIRGRGIDFDEVRAYQPGDDIRTMDWRVTARTGSPHTKVYREERERPVYFVVDYSPSLFFGTRNTFKSVVAAKASALLAFSAASHGDRVGGIVFSGKVQQEVQAHSGEKGVLTLLKMLADKKEPLQNHQEPGDLGIVLKRLRQVVRPGSFIVILSDFNTLDHETQLLLQELGVRHDILLGLIYDPLETTPPPPNLYAVTNGTSLLTIDSNNPKWREKYPDAFQTKKNILEKIGKHPNISLIEFSTQNSTVQTLRQFFYS